MNSPVVHLINTRDIHQLTQTITVLINSENTSEQKYSEHNNK